MTRRLWWVVGGVLVALAGLTWWLLAGGDRGAAIANVLALPVGAVGLLVAIISLVRPNDRADRVQAASEDLAVAVARREAAALAQLLGDVGDPRPANVGFSQPLPVRWRTDGGERNGNLAQVAEYYSSLERGRLVVIGEPGSGKTVLAVQLIIDLLKNPTSKRVPMRLSLPTFDQNLDDASDEELARRLDTWMADQLATLGMGKLARELIAGGWVLPVLDGLDEMDLDGAPPERATAVIRAINVAARTRPMVLTCRRARYDQLGTVVQDATVVMLESLTPETVREYLTYRFPDPTRPTELAPRWHALANALAGPSDPLLEALRSPWHLFLCITAFADGGDPYQELADLSPRELTNTLLDRLIPTAVTQHPGFKPTDVKHWLTTLAHHLQWQGQQGGSRSDILLHELWPAAGLRAPRYIAGTVLVVLMSLPALFAIGLPYLRNIGFPPTTPGAWLGLVLPVVAGCIMLILASGQRVDLARLDTTQLRTRQGRRSITGWLIFGLGLGLAIGLFSGLTQLVPGGFSFSFQYGLAVGVAVGLTVGLRGRLGAAPSYIRMPNRLVRQGMSHDFTVCIVSGLPIGLTAGFGVALEHGLAYGVAAGLGFGIAFGPSPWPRYLVALVMLQRREALPFRLTRFLNWAYTAGLVRLSGIGIQFRHQQFQEWLISAQPEGHRPRPGLPSQSPPAQPLPRSAP